MIVRFTDRGTEVAGVPGERLLDAAWRAGLPLEGTCNGQIACATCHVRIEPADFARLRPASPDEEDMLDLVPNATRHSRLACQVILDGTDLAVSLPGSSRTGQVR